MPRRDRSPVPSFSRRETLSGGLVFGAASLLGVAPFKSAFAQATPDASPVPENAYANPDALVDAASLGSRLSGSGLVLVGFMPLEEFEQGHIPDSVQIDWPELKVVDTSDASLDAWQHDLERIVADLGISQESTVVAYDRGTLFAARFWWILRYLGHGDVHVLKGGLAAWREGENEIDAGAPSGADVLSEPYPGTPRPDTLAQLNEVVDSLGRDDTVIIDARTPNEYAEGHIPGAVNVNYPLNARLESPKYWKPADELLTLYESVGVTKDKLVIPYCSTGVRSAVTAYTLHLLGYPDVALYTGSWEEWGDDPDTPKTEGDQP